MKREKWFYLTENCLTQLFELELYTKKQLVLFGIILNGCEQQLKVALTNICNLIGKFTSSSTMREHIVCVALLLNTVKSVNASLQFTLGLSLGYT